jgi:hypothetical protein
MLILNLQKLPQQVYGPKTLLTEIKVKHPFFHQFFVANFCPMNFLQLCNFFNGFEISIKLCVFDPDLTCGEKAQKPEKLFYQRVLALHFRTINNLGKPSCTKLHPNVQLEHLTGVFRREPCQIFLSWHK